MWYDFDFLDSHPSQQNGHEKDYKGKELTWITLED